ncbi:peptidase M36 [Pyxidicoccus fallax]|uniref:Peptidase M36 n=1 Tax=Pyxidicoccus fallax TaxID=394095 RepID=A0A848LCA6_9BACT|nr:M36 family metallopeptidase [Pyxidicoccus fallax]NMO14363.1 peptidase M36 [Pyxidicoccus fallax]NPC77152.1 peptidase M36 [Pyxidicoccus fallax]
MTRFEDVFPFRLRRTTLAVGAASALWLMAPTPAHAVSAPVVQAHAGLADFDSRTGFVLPTRAQLDAVRTLGATVRWNAFGTPASLISHDGFLGNAPGADAGTAAREWVRANRELFRLSDADVTSLELVNAAKLAGSSGRAVLFRQRFGLLPSAQDGLITVGLVDGKVAYVSSSAVGSQAEPAPALLSATQAWLAAASNVGRVLSLVNLTGLRVENGWSVFSAAGLSQLQRARLVAFPTPTQGVKAAFETIVLDVNGGQVQAYTSFVDARTGEVLFRQDRVQNLALPDTFSGAYQDAPAAQACGPLHPFEVPAGTRSITVAAQPAVATNDISINLLFNGVTVASADLLTSPEVLHYAPGSLPSGIYQVQVCPYAAPTLPPVGPFTYVGTFVTNDVDTNPLDQGPRWKLFTSNPPLDYSATDTRVTACWTSGEGCDATLKNTAARAPWDYDFRTGLPTFTTIGNAAITAEAWLSPLTPAEQYRPLSPVRDYSFTWTNQWHTSRCSPLALLSPQRNDVDAATANLFAMHNRMHDWSYFLGFTEENYNLQLSNFGNPSTGGQLPTGGELDPELGNVQAGALTGGAPTYLGRDNANQVTLNDGIPGITNMYLWQPIAGSFYAPCVDGDYDMSVIGHEYTHAISNRMVGGPDGNLTGLQAGAMGESWSDLVAVEYLLEYGLAPTSGNPFAVGGYVTGHPGRGIRNYGMNDSPLNYSNIGYDMTGPQSHSDGEVWSATNHGIRQAFIERYDFAYPSSNAQLQAECANGQRHVTECPGNRRWMQLVFDAFLLMQPGVSMVDARDAYLAADRMRFGGAHQALLWREFARRGLGSNASSVTAEDTQPVPGFDTPVDTAQATVTFDAVASDEGFVPVKAKVYVGQYEARSRPAADTDPDTTLSPTLRLVPGTYDFVVKAEGHGLQRFRWTFGPGEVKTLTARLPTNWASMTKGATATGDGVNHDKLIDDTETTNWARLNAVAVGGTKVTVALAGGPRSVRQVNVSALLRPTDENDAGGDTGSQNRFTALRAFDVYACKASVLNLNCTLDTGFTRVYSSAHDAFPGDVPRPSAPDLQLRSFLIPETVATHLQLRVVTNQCTGGYKFHGDQDADPLNDSDCVSGSTADNAVRAAEFQVFSSGPLLTE